MPALIEVQNLTYEYPGKRALHEITFSVNSGSVVALVGPNGAGKTTLMRCLAALETPFSGSVRIAGIDTQKHPRTVHSQVAYLADFYGLYENLTVLQSLTHMAAMHGVPAEMARTTIDQVALELDLMKLLSSRSSQLSRGQRQRLAIAMAIIHKPPVLLLDEPAAGLDPEARHALSALISSFRARGMTVVVSSHILSELEDYSTEMLTIQNGKIIGHGAVTELTTTVERRRVRVKCLQPTSEVLTSLQEIVSNSEIVASHDEISFVLEGGAKAYHQVLKTIVERGLEIYSFSVEEVTLQDIYLRQIKHPASERGTQL